MTKEDILSKFYNTSYDSLDGYSQSTALKAMDEWGIAIISCIIENKMDFSLPDFEELTETPRQTALRNYNYIQEELKSRSRK